jgi:hypothetical protein
MFEILRYANCANMALSVAMFIVKLTSSFMATTTHDESESNLIWSNGT